MSSLAAGRTKVLMALFTTLMPDDIDNLLNEAAADKIGDYRADYSNGNSISYIMMPAVDSTFGRHHCELVFLQAHKETVRMFAASGVEHAQHNHPSHSQTSPLLFTFLSLDTTFPRSTW
jgi:hypothetical protein